MVLLAAAVCNKTGTAIISRQFVEMTRSRIEGLLAAFPKLMNIGKQHTFVETESVRYVYQPLEKIYMLLITTKASNILEDLETLRLFARLIPEYCKTMEEAEIVNQAFPLIFAFDEVVALGYRENVNLAQIKTFTEMDSHEEKVFQAVRQNQEREAMENAKRKAKELQKQRTDAIKSGRNPASVGGFGSASSGRGSSPILDTGMPEPVKPAYTAPSKPVGGGRALKLGSKAKDVDSFVEQLQTEGQGVIGAASVKAASSKSSASRITAEESVTLKHEEKLSLTIGRDGGLQNLEVHGLISLKITDENYGRIKVLTANNDKKGIQLQTHPNIDKKMFQTSSWLILKTPAKPFPINQDIGVLKWRYQSQDESSIPLTITCWPTETPTGCDVSVEYELTNTSMELNDVVITIPVLSGVGAPVITSCEGGYHHDSRKSRLEWQLPHIDDSNKSGQLEFSIKGHPSDFFPVTVTFTSTSAYCDIEMLDVRTVDDEAPVKFSKAINFTVDKYEIV